MSPGRGIWGERGAARPAWGLGAGGGSCGAEGPLWEWEGSCGVGRGSVGLGVCEGRVWDGGGGLWGWGAGRGAEGPVGWGGMTYWVRGSV